MGGCAAGAITASTSRTRCEALPMRRAYIKYRVYKKYMPAEQPNLRMATLLRVGRQGLVLLRPPTLVTSPGGHHSICDDRCRVPYHRILRTKGMQRNHVSLCSLGHMGRP